MAEEAKPILTTDTLTGAENKRDTSGDQMVKVKALATFHKEGSLKGELVTPDSDPFDVPRQRAAQLRANGLISYVTDGDGALIHGETDAKRFDAVAARRLERSKIPENSKTTPLINPEVKMAKLKDAE